MCVHTHFDKCPNYLEAVYLSPYLQLSQNVVKTCQILCPRDYKSPIFIACKAQRTLYTSEFQLDRQNTARREMDICYQFGF